MAADDGLTTLYLAMTAIFLLLGGYLIYLHRLELSLRRDLRRLGTLLERKPQGRRRGKSSPTTRGSKSDAEE